MAGAELDRVEGDPTPDEVAAVLAALEVAWPRAVRGVDPDEPTRWRFSGRWWTKPVLLRRERPW